MSTQIGQATIVTIEGAVGGGTSFPAVPVHGVGPAADAFGNLRVTSPQQLLASQFTFDTLPLLWVQSLVGGGTATHLPNESAISLAVTAANGDSVVRQTKKYLLYRAGQSQLIKSTFAGMIQETNVRKRVGYFDAQNGIFFEVNGATDIAVVLRSFTSGSAVDTRVVQSAWNLDKLNGLGPSGLTLDLTKANHLVIDLQWLGVGAVRIGFDINGMVHYVHQFFFANIGTTVYMTTGSLPVRYEITTTAGGGAGGSFKQICSGVLREAGSVVTEGYLAAIDTGIAVVNATTTPRSALSLDLQADHIRAFLLPLHVSLLNQGTGTVRWRLVLNPTLGGALTFVDVNQASRRSITQQTYTEGTGQVLASGFAFTQGNNAQVISADLSSLSNLGVAADIAGVSDVLSLIVDAASGTQTINASLSYLELF